jgi:DNA-binding NarL/FixJ family response regulator
MDRIRVILADDHAVVREGTRQLLERESDLEVVGEAADGLEAVDLARRLHPDVAIIDIAMPGMNGIEATRQIKSMLPATAVLVLSAYDDDQYIFALLEAGAAGYLLKNVHGRELIEAVRAVHGGESVLHPRVARKVLDRFTPGTGKPRPPTLAAQLSEREMEVLRLAARGLSNKDIAQELVLSVRTVQAHLGNIFNKMGVGSRTEAVIYGLKAGWLTLEDIA